MSGPYAIRKERVGIANEGSACWAVAYQIAPETAIMLSHPYVGALNILPITFDAEGGRADSRSLKGIRKGSEYL